MKPPLHFTRLRVGRMPGIPEPYTLGTFSPGVTLVHGPNASGKSTTARALKALLWPGRRHPPPVEVEGEFTLEGARWRVEVDAHGTRVQRNGTEVAPSELPVPPEEGAERYDLSLHSLLQADDRDLARRIVRDSQGGYDIAAAAEALGFRAALLPASARQGPAQARERLRERRERVAELVGEERKLEDLEQQIRNLDAAARRLGALEALRDRARAGAAAAAAEERLRGFPEGMERLREGMARELAKHQEREESARRDEEAAAARVKELEAALAESPLGAGGAPQGIRLRLRERVAELDDSVRRAREHRQALDRSRRALEGQRLEAGLPEVGIPSPGDLQALESHLRRREEAHLERAQVLRELEALGPPPSGPEEEPVVDPALHREEGAVRALRLWLQTPAPSAPPASPALSAGSWALAVALAGLWTLALLRGDAVAFAMAAVVTAGALLLRAVGRPPPPGDTPDPRRSHKAAAEQLGVVLPEPWSPEAVAAELQRREGSLDAAREEGRRREQALLLRRRLRRAEEALEAVAREEVPLLERWPLLRSTQGVDRILLARDLQRAAELMAELAGQEGELLGVEAHAGGLLEALVLELPPLDGVGEVRDLAAARAAVQLVEEALEGRQETEAELEGARTLRDSAAREAARAREDRLRLLEEAGIPEEEEGQVGSRVERLPEWRQAQSALRDAEVRKREAAERAGTPPPELAALPATELERLALEAREAAESLPPLQRRATEIRVRLEQAREAHDVEAALAELDRVEAEAAERRARVEDAHLGLAVAEWLEETSREQERPEVFRRASALFQEITRDRYRLEVDQREERFRAVEPATGRGFDLGALSSGTRVQLLLAVRVAFLEHQEERARLPLFLDETLANSDDHRAGAIIDAALGLARGGRQILYFTAQGDEVARWRSRLGPEAGVPLTEVDLAARRRLGARESVEIPSHLPAAPYIPDPGDHDHTAFGRALPAPALDLHSVRAPGLHLWYLVEDLPLLHHLLGRGYTRWGQLEGMVRRTGDPERAGVPAPAWEAWRTLAAAADGWLEGWRVGRPPPVPREALARSEAVSDVMAPRVEALARSVGWDGARILQGLREGAVPRFHLSKMEELAAELAGSGHLDSRPPLDRDELRIRADEAVSARGLPPADREAIGRLLARLEEAGRKQ